MLKNIGRILRQGETPDASINRERSPTETALTSVSVRGRSVRNAEDAWLPGTLPFESAFESKQVMTDPQGSSSSVYGRMALTREESGSEK
jgi:hypothetical protein